MGIVVLGMHRSGTSAVTELLSTFGFETGQEQDLISESEGNPRGHFEVESLMHTNETILGDAGGAVFNPPPLDSIDTSFATSAKDHLDSFRSHFKTANYLWKDPRLCLTLGAWATVLDDLVGAVLVVRDPLVVADSLRRRGDVPDVAAGVALWEVYNRSALAHLAGRPTLVVNYGQLVEDPETSIETISDSIQQLGGIEPPSPSIAKSVIKTSLDRSTRADCPLDAAQSELWENLKSYAGFHNEFSPVPAQPLSVAAQQVLDTRRVWSRLDMSQLRTVVAGTTYRVTQWPITELIAERDHLDNTVNRLRDESKIASTEDQRRYDELYAKYLSAIDAVAGAVAAKGSAIGQLRVCQGDVISAQTDYKEWESKLFEVTSELADSKAELESLSSVTGRRIVRFTADKIRNRSAKQ